MPKITIIKHIFTLVILLLITACSDEQAKEVQTPDAAAVQLNNIGVGQMGYFDYESAFVTFTDLNQQYPKWQSFKHNLIIAMLNRQQSGDESNAVALLEEMMSEDDTDVVTRYLLGILRYNSGDCDAASQHFHYVKQQDPSDAYALYFLAQCQLQMNALSEAQKNFNTAIEQDPYLRSAYYGAFMTSQRLGLNDVAQQRLKEYSRLEMNPKARLAEIKYTRMGSKALAQTHAADQLQKRGGISIEPGPAFSAGTKVTVDRPNTSFTPMLNTETFVTELLAPADGQIVVYQYPEFSVVNEIAVPGITASSLISVADFNNDHLMDFYITDADSKHNDVILIQQQAGEFSPLDAAAIKVNNPIKSKQVKIFDADHDGDLDVVTIDVEGRFNLLNNNGNMTFSDITAEVIDANDNQAVLQVMALDIDGDRDLDLLLLTANTLLLLENDRMWNYQLHRKELSADTSMMAAQFADDGTVMLWAAGANQQPLIQYQIDPINFNLIEVNQWSITGLQQFGLLDVNADGSDELLSIENNVFTVRLLEDMSMNFQADTTSDSPAFTVIQTPSGPEIITAGSANEVDLYPASEYRAQFIHFSFSGAQKAADSMRSNTLGLGTEFIVFNGQLTKKGSYLNNSQLPNQGLQAVSVAAFGDAIDYIQMEWSDGVMQTELQLPANQHHHLTETQRQLSSCPVLFVKQGDGFEFITDVLGVGGMGFAIGKDQFASPRPWENLIVTEYVNPAQTELEFYLTEPMEESVYLDQVELHVYDIPEDYHVVLDERMATNEVQATGEMVFYKSQILPVKVTDGAGNDETELNNHVDSHALRVGALDRDFLGYLERPQSHVFEFDQSLSGAYQLIINGWVEYGYSQTGFAAWQAGMKLDFPSLEIRVDDEWQVALQEFGYPAGMPKFASVAFDTHDQIFDAIRLSTNQEVYFDQVSLAEIVAAPAIKHQQLPLASAELRALGYPKRTDGKDRYPRYDFADRQPFWDTRYMTGAYTRLGDVKELILEQDNALALVAAGEGINYTFTHNLTAVEPGMQRIYVMRFIGWAKDMDLMTQEGETLAPIPADGEVSELAEQLNARYNVRFLSGQ